MRVQHFTTQKSGAFEKRTSGKRREIEPDGSLVFKHDAIEVPASWSQVACDVLAQNIFAKLAFPRDSKGWRKMTFPLGFGGVPDPDALKDLPKEDRYVGETSAKQVFNRLGAGPIGAGKAAISIQQPTLAHIMMK